jgi:small GTP-binding protein
LLICHKTGSPPEDYIPTVFDIEVLSTNFEGESFEYTLVDTAGAEEYNTVRTSAYPDTDLILLCYSVNYVGSFENITTKWVPEIEQNWPGNDCHVLVVGLKTDLRDDSITLDTLKEKGLEPVSSGAGQKLALQIGAMGYLECSVKERRGVDEIFQAVFCWRNEQARRLRLGSVIEQDYRIPGFGSKKKNSRK